MKRSNSLKKNREFNYVYRAGKSFGSSFSVMIVVRARHQSVKVGFSVSKKIGNAVIRNLVKRRMREAFRHCISRIRPGTNIVFVARQSAAGESYQSILRGMEKLLKKANLLQGENDVKPFFSADEKVRALKP